MNKTAITFIILILLGLGIEAALLLKLITIPKDLSFLNQSKKTQSVVPINIAPQGGQVIAVSLKGSGFNPKDITVHLGDKIIWTNNSAKDATINSDTHPIHDLYPILNLGNFSPGQTLRIILREQGRFTYHNHLSPSQTGTIIVK